MKRHLLLLPLCALTFSGIVCAQETPPAPRTLNVQGEEFSSACTPQNKATLSAQLPAEAWVLVETLLCEKKSATSRAYIANHTYKTVKYEISSTGDKDEAKRILADAELIDSLQSEGEAWDADLMATENEITIRYRPNEACVHGRTLQLKKRKWKIIGLSEACD